MNNIIIILTGFPNNGKHNSKSPIMPCNNSELGSFSLDARDFFDDEIADQPGLMFSGPPSESCNTESIDNAIFRLGNHSCNNKKCNNLFFIKELHLI